MCWLVEVTATKTCCLFQPCHVVYTDYRPVPLQHYIFPAGGDGLHLVVDENVSVILLSKIIFPEKSLIVLLRNIVFRFCKDSTAHNMRVVIMIYYAMLIVKTNWNVQCCTECKTHLDYFCSNNIWLCIMFCVVTEWFPSRQFQRSNVSVTWCRGCRKGGTERKKRGTKRWDIRMKCRTRKTA